MKNFFALYMLVFLMLAPREVWGLTIWFRDSPQNIVTQEIGFAFTSKDEASGIIKPPQDIGVKLALNPRASFDVYAYVKLNISADIEIAPAWSRLSDDVYYYGAANVLEAVSGDCAVFDDVVSGLSQPFEASTKIFLVRADEVEYPAMADEIFFTMEEVSNDR